MNLVESFIFKLQAKEIKLWLEGESLRFTAPRGVMTPELKTEIRAYKPGIIAFLQQNRWCNEVFATDMT